MDQQSTFRRLGPLFVLLAVVLLVPVLALAQDQPPGIPHSVEGQEDCLLCHAEGVAGAPEIPEDHEGRPNETCQACHQMISAEEEETETATSTPTQAATSTATSTR